MLALAVQALSLVSQRPRDPWLPVITLLLLFAHTHTHTHTLSFPLCLFTFPSVLLFYRRFSRSVSLPILLSVLCILLPHDKYQVNIRQSFLSLFVFLALSPCLLLLASLRLLHCWPTEYTPEDGNSGDRWVRSCERETRWITNYSRE